MPTFNLTPLALLCTAAALLALPAQAAVNEKAKPRNRIAAKIKPAPAPAPVVDEDAALSEEQLAVAPRVHQGEAQCEFNQKVHLSPHPDKPGRFRLQFNKMVYTLAPEPTTTGAVRLEDKRAGVVWLQIPSKSMLMNAKIGQRMVDACLHPEQLPVAEAAPSADTGIGITPTSSTTTVR
jgi:hypothetical protein